MGDNDGCSWPKGCGRPSLRFEAWDLPGQPSVPRMFCAEHEDLVQVNDQRIAKGLPWLWEKEPTARQMTF